MTGPTRGDGPATEGTGHGMDDPDRTTSDSGRSTDDTGSDDPPARLLLDAMLGKLATYLRMCGYDAAYALDRGVEADDRLLDLAGAEDRRLVTRDRTLAARAPGSVLLRTRAVTDQLRELREAGFDLSLDDRPSRCGSCNGPVDRVDPGESTPGYAPDPAGTAVWRCRECGQCFWRGSHWDDVRRRLEDL